MLALFRALIYIVAWQRVHLLWHIEWNWKPSHTQQHLSTARHRTIKKEVADRRWWQALFSLKISSQEVRIIAMQSSEMMRQHKTRIYRPTSRSLSLVWSLPLPLSFFLFLFFWSLADVKKKQALNTEHILWPGAASESCRKTAGAAKLGALLSSQRQHPCLF